MNVPGEDWKVEKRRQECTECGTEFEPGSPFFSALLESEGEFQRLDYCPECWQSRNSGDFFCFWKSRRPESDGRQAVGPAVLLDLLEQMRDPANRREKALRFVLALYLSRKKVLTLQQEDDGGDGTLLFEAAKGDEEYRVEPVELEESERAELTRNLQNMLSVEG